MPNLLNETLFSPTVEATILISGLDGLGYIPSRMISSFTEKKMTKLGLRGGEGHSILSILSRLSLLSSFARQGTEAVRWNDKCKLKTYYFLEWIVSHIFL